MSVCEACDRVVYPSREKPFALHPSGMLSGPSGRICTFDTYECPIGNGWHVALTGRVPPADHLAKQEDPE